jgi:hypothetical protein
MGRESGQAAVETALTLPLVLFLILGSMQLFLLSQSRLLAQYGVFQATRVGSVNHGACTPMTHAALLSVLPMVHSFLGDTGGPPSTQGEKLGRAFGRFRDNHYGGYRGPGWDGVGGADEALVWLVREQPRPLTPTDVFAFDQPLPRPDRGEPLRLEVRMVFWAPLRIPFADWVFTRIAAARLGIQAYTDQNPLMLTQRADWAAGPPVLAARTAAELSKRIARRHYAFPIEVTSTMRMMSPPRLSEFTAAECAAPGFVP